MRFGGSNDERLSGERYRIGVGLGFVWMMMEWLMGVLMGVLAGVLVELLMGL